jgi:hypothetical protein
MLNRYEQVTIRAFLTFWVCWLVYWGVVDPWRAANDLSMTVSCTYNPHLCVAERREDAIYLSKPFWGLFKETWHRRLSRSKPYGVEYGLGLVAPGVLLFGALFAFRWIVSPLIRHEMSDSASDRK